MNNIAAGSALLLAVFTAVSLPGCSKLESPKAPAPPPQSAPGTSTAPAPAPTAAAPARPPFAAGQPAPAATGAAATAPKARSASGAAIGRATQQPVLRAVRTGAQPGADRVVFEFDAATLPAWQVEYVERPVHDCGSGDAVPVGGQAWLQVRFTGAQAHTDKGASTGGPRRRALALPLARELVRTCDFEGEVTWVVGVARPNAYTATALSAPYRLVIDIAH